MVPFCPNCLKAMTLSHSFRVVEEGRSSATLYASACGVGLTQVDDERTDEGGQ
jgi:hypothetical protein